MNRQLVNQWTKEGFENLILHGALYGEKQGPMPAWSEKFHTMFDWDNVGLCFFMMTTGQALPTHRDHYETYCRLHNIQNPKTISRAIVFLEDWQSGHYFEIDDKPIVDWVAGDYVYWEYDTAHYAGNFGIDPRYTLQITGTTK